MADLVSVKDVAQAANPAPPLCWICNRNQANSGEHKTKRSDLLAVLGNPTQEAPFFYSDLKKANRPVKSLKADILKSPVRICADCNTMRTQPHDRAWERMSDRLRGRRLKVGQWVRASQPWRRCALAGRFLCTVILSDHVQHLTLIRIIARNFI
jgi:hypothetical protein